MGAVIYKLVFISALLASHSVSAFDCQRIIKELLGLADKGIWKVEPSPTLPLTTVQLARLPFTYPYGSTVSFVGEGGNGKVYRVRDNEGGSEIFKVYETEKQRNRDFHQITVLKNLPQPNENRSTFKVAEVFHYTDRVLRMEDVTGVPLNKVLEDPTISEEIRGRLIKLYEQRMEVFLQQMKTQRPEVTIYPGLVDNKSGVRSYVVTLANARTTSESFANTIVLKPKNIILTADFEMKIIDSN